MTIKTAHDLTSSLRGSAFRRAAFDGRTIDLRRIMTMREMTADRCPGRGHHHFRLAVPNVRTFRPSLRCGTRARK